MSLKLIEFQLALPRTYDMGKIQESINQQSQIMQTYLADDLKKREMRARKQVQSKEEIAEVKWDREGTPPQSYNKKKLEGKHPYKGSVIDFTG